MEQNFKQENPLAAFMRQPKIYIRLPSQGQYWKEGSLEISSTGEYPVYSMTAKDELLLKIPDALLNGQAVVDVIQNCMPNVKDAWEMPSLDVDAILVAIRMATYGNNMTMPVKFGKDLELEYEMDLSKVLDTLLEQISWNTIVPISDEMTVYVRPLVYRQMTKTAVATFETQKIMQVISSQEMDDAQKIEIFKDSFRKLTEMTLGVVTDSVYKIDTSSGSTSNKEFIEEFINNADKEIFNKIKDHLDSMSVQNTTKPMIINVTDEMQEEGITGDTVEVPITFDAATFFV
jgi:hypothetical protein